MEHKFSKVARFWYQYFRFVYIFREIWNWKTANSAISKTESGRTCEIWFICCKFKAKMAIRSKVLEDLKNSLTFRLITDKKFSELVEVQKVVKNFNIRKWWCFKGSNQKYCFKQKVIWIIPWIYVGIHSLASIFIFKNARNYCQSTLPITTGSPS